MENVKKMTSLSGASFCVRLLLRPVNRKSAPIRPYIYICHRQKTAHKSSIDFFFLVSPPRKETKNVEKKGKGEKNKTTSRRGLFADSQDQSWSTNSDSFLPPSFFSLSSFSVGCCCVSYINIRRTKKEKIIKNKNLKPNVIFFFLISLLQLRRRFLCVFHSRLKPSNDGDST
jgi:hypothetical protein